MKMSEIIAKKGLSVGVFGIGESCLGVINYLKQKNPTLTVTIRSDQPIENELCSSAKRVFIGSQALSDITEDILFLSPSARRDRSEIKEAQKRGVIISSDAELFFNLTQSRPIVITGSDGKSTTTRLIADAYTSGGIPAIPCGNYGKSLCQTLLDNLFPVIELSSFQLNFFSPHTSYSVITNITPNHLNWHTSLDEYVGAKMNAVKNAQKIVFDADSTITAECLKKEEVFAKVSLDKTYKELKRVGGSENYITQANGIIYLNGFPFFDISHAIRREKYNIRNYLLTAAVCFEDCTAEAISSAITSFRGLSHRSELFFERSGIKYVNSSIDSSPQRTLQTLSALDDKPVAIIGGMSKGLCVKDLALALPTLTRGAVLLGEVGKEIALILNIKKKDFPFEYAKSMTDAVVKAKVLSQGHGYIILTPAATSFDRYKNFVERGNDFKRIVLSLENDK